jgi:hypothetical protein
MRLEGEGRKEARERVDRELREGERERSGRRGVGAYETKERRWTSVGDEKADKLHRRGQPHDVVDRES